MTSLNKRIALFESINSLSSDIEFSFQNKDGSICPFSRDNISVSYGNDEISCNSVDEAMEIKIFNGKSLNEIVDEITIY